MERRESRVRRMGFTMLEVIVVMGIIGILLAVMMPLLSGTRNSALTAQCKNNMKSLAMGAIAYAQARSENDGHFPSAGFYRTLTHKRMVPGRSRGKGVSYYPERSWISNNGPVVDLNRTVNSVLIGTVVHFTDADEIVRMAITNGVVWKASGESYEVYRCPLHARSFEKVHGRLPGWSYMMNQEFGFNRDEKGNHTFFGAIVGNNITVATDVAGLRKKKASRSPDKVLMFAEVQGADVTDSQSGASLKALVNGSGFETDAVLEYAKEEMGFTHPMGKGKYGGNVAFADGHVDTIIMPTKMNRKDLTRYLCQGFDVPHDGRSYTPSTVDE